MPQTLTSIGFFQSCTEEEKEVIASDLAVAFKHWKKVREVLVSVDYKNPDQFFELLIKDLKEIT